MLIVQKYGGTSVGNLERIEEVSSLGVDFISVGALTHSPQALDISLKFHEIK